jgi:hypothetical protein
MAQGISIDASGVQRLLQRLSQANLRVQQTTRRILGARLIEAVRYARTNFLTGGTTSERLAVRTGRLRAAFGSSLRGEGVQIEGRLGYIVPQGAGSAGADPLIYARVHEGWPQGRRSTSIRPKRARYLTVPLEAAKTGAGVARGRARDFEDTFVARSRAGNLIIFQRQGDGTIAPLFLLLPEVTIPARPALRPTVAYIRPLIVEDLARELPQAILSRGGRP